MHAGESMLVAVSVALVAIGIPCADVISDDGTALEPAGDADAFAAAERPGGSLASACVGAEINGNRSAAVGPQQHRAATTIERDDGAAHPMIVAECEA